MSVTLYSVYEPPSEAQDLKDRADSLVFVKEGFSWPALFIPGLWLIYRRMWLELVLFLGDLRRAALERRGYKQIGTAIGAGRDFAELAFFKSWLPQQERGRPRESAPPERPGNASIPAPKTSGEAEGVIGLFPAP